MNDFLYYKRRMKEMTDNHVSEREVISILFGAIYAILCYIIQKEGG